MDISDKLKIIDKAFKNYYHSDDGEGYHKEELNYEVFILLKNGKKYNFLFTDLIIIDFARQRILFRYANNSYDIHFSAIKNAHYEL